jgi:hypothetical protein
MPANEAKSFSISKSVASINNSQDQKDVELSLSINFSRQRATSRHRILRRKRFACLISVSSIGKKEWTLGEERVMSIEWDVESKSMGLATVEKFSKRLMDNVEGFNQKST